MRTVRSVAQARNQPHPGLGWLILFVLIALLAFTARLAAADDVLLDQAGSPCSSDEAREADIDDPDLEAADITDDEAESFDPTWADAGSVERCEAGGGETDGVDADGADKPNADGDGDGDDDDDDDGDDDDDDVRRAREPGDSSLPSRPTAHSLLGRIDLIIAWRRAAKTSASITDDSFSNVPAISSDVTASGRGELWILATWRR